jgi:hypothetical protein
MVEVKGRPPVQDATHAYPKAKPSPCSTTFNEIKEKISATRKSQVKPSMSRVKANAPQPATRTPTHLPLIVLNLAPLVEVLKGSRERKKDKTRRAASVQVKRKNVPVT